MDRNEITKELQMPYTELQRYLIDKYGGAICDYFTSPECKSKNRKVTRTSEGLYCHHMDEDKGGNLGNSFQARLQPFEWQKKDRLVYCNILEHLILHIKIAVLRQKRSLEVPGEVANFFTTGGIFMICKEINDMFMNDGTQIPWKQKCFHKIAENYQDYIILLKALMNYIDAIYQGNKTENPFLSPGSKVHFSDKICEILKVPPQKDRFLLKLPSGEEKTFDSVVALGQFTYTDQTDIALRRMSSGYEAFYPEIYEEILQCNEDTLIQNWKNYLSNDFNGYGFPQYSSITLDKSFGSHNADEYISKALPMHCEATTDLRGKMPHFWKGSQIPVNANHLFYIVRIKASFSIKDGMEPFVRYREKDLLRCQNLFTVNENHNFNDCSWKILATSDIYDERSNKYISKYKLANSNVVAETVVVSLGKEDYLLFKECYSIRHLEILDGCYFC